MDGRHDQTSFPHDPRRRGSAALRPAPPTEGFVVYKRVDVKALRARLELAQPEFARRYGLSVGTVRDWEQGRSVPDTPAQVLLRVIEAEPEIVRRVLETP